MGFFDSITKGIQNHFNKRREEQEMMDQLQKEVEIKRIQAFKEEYKKNALQVAISKAKEDAAQKSGLQQMRALNRARRLQEGGQQPGSFFERLSEYTQKNIAKREENLKHTEAMRQNSEVQRSNQQNQRVASRPQRSQAFGRSSWKP